MRWPVPVAGAVGRRVGREPVRVLRARRRARTLDRHAEVSGGRASAAGGVDLGGAGHRQDDARRAGGADGARLRARTSCTGAARRDSASRTSRGSPRCRSWSTRPTKRCSRVRRGERATRWRGCSRSLARRLVDAGAVGGQRRGHRTVLDPRGRRAAPRAGLDEQRRWWWCSTTCTGWTRRACSCCATWSPPAVPMAVLVVGTFRESDLSRAHPLIGCARRSAPRSRASIASICRVSKTSRSSTCWARRRATRWPTTGLTSRTRCAARRAATRSSWWRSSATSPRPGQFVQDDDGRWVLSADLDRLGLAVERARGGRAPGRASGRTDRTGNVLSPR